MIERQTNDLRSLEAQNAKLVMSRDRLKKRRGELESVLRDVRQKLGGFAGEVHALISSGIEVEREKRETCQRKDNKRITRLDFCPRTRFD